MRFSMAVSRWFAGLTESTLFKSYIMVPKSPEGPEKNAEEIVDEFELASPPAYSLPLEKLTYDKNDKGLGTSCNKVVKGVDVTGCDLFLMSRPTSGDYKKSDQNHLYLYKNEKEQIFYRIQDSVFNLEIPQSIKGKKEFKFEQSEIKPVKCENLEICTTVLGMTSKAGHTHVTNSYIKFKDNQPMLYVESLMMHLYSMSLVYGVARSYVRTNVDGNPVATSGEALDTYDLELMAKLPSNDKNQAATGTIYLSSDDGTYVVRDPKRVVQTGSLKDSGIDLRNLANRLNDPELKKQILEVTSKAGHTSEGLCTFKNHTLSQKDLDDPAYRHRFLEALAVMDRMHEDDGHRENITLLLQLYDGDCTYWEATCEVKGPEPIDRTWRNPKTAFHLSEANIKRFPNPIEGKMRYRPGLDGNLAKAWSVEENELVRKLEGPEARGINFLIKLDWMLDLSRRFESVAKLHFPKDLPIVGKYSGIHANAIQLYCDTNKNIDQEDWSMLPSMPEFQEYFHQSYEQIAQEILIRCEIRNQRFENEKKIHPYHDDEFNAAKLDPHSVIAKLNELIELVNSKRILTVSVYPDHSILFATKRMGEEDKYAKKIDEVTADRLMANAKVVAQQMMEFEKTHDVTKWDEFARERKKIDKKMQENNEYIHAPLGITCNTVILN